MLKHDRNTAVTIEGLTQGSPAGLLTVGMFKVIYVNNTKKLTAWETFALKPY